MLVRVDVGRAVRADATEQPPSELVHEIAVDIDVAVDRDRSRLPAVWWRWLFVPLAGGVVGYVVALWQNEDCPSVDAALSACTRLKPVHSAVIGFALGFAALLVVYAVARLLSAVGAFRRPPGE